MFKKRREIEALTRRNAKLESDAQIDYDRIVELRHDIIDLHDIIAKNDSFIVFLRHELVKRNIEIPPAP